ncbi:MAG: FAD-binding protein [Acidimicrobiia bacterium]
MRAIVLVKQVPDVRVGSVAMRPDGTIDRSSAAAITNPADLHALEAALQLADEVWAVSMGPSRAESTLREAIALGAHRGVLLTDRLFAGSDTWATANALSAAIRHLGGADLVLGGITALDGETGHVGPQVAQRLGLPQATGCEDLCIEDGRLFARRIIEGGYELLSLPLPALATVAETGFLPRYPTLPGRRRAAEAEITVLSAADLGLDAGTVGLNASPTKVAHMELVPMPKMDCRFVDDEFTYDGLVAELLSLALPAPVSEPAPVVVGAEPAMEHAVIDEPKVWVVGETRDGLLAEVSAELLTQAVRLASHLGGGVAALLIGSGLDQAAEEAARFGADLVLVAEDDRLASYRGLPEARILAVAAAERQPEVILLGATTTGRDLAPRVAAMLDTGIAADCTDLYIADWQHRGTTYPSLLHQVRPAMAGGVLATCLCPEKRPQIATVRPGVFPVTHHQRALRKQLLTVQLEPGDFAVEVLERSLQRTDVGLRDAEVIVAGGAGCNASNWHLIDELATHLGGRVAATRAAVEAGLAPRSLQVGQTGMTVRPRLYVACGISGALQHGVGMKASRTILAINRDSDAAIFRFAQYGIVDDVTVALPKLISAFARYSGEPPLARGGP